MKELNKTIKIDGQKYKIGASFIRDGARDRKMRIYLFPQDETVIENFKERRNRDKKLWRKISLQVLEAFKYTNVKIVFGQNVGCSCGCSPGFITDMKNGQELFIDYKKVK